MSDGITQLTPEQFAAQKASAAKENYIERVLVDAVDVPLNVVTGGLPDETISSRAARDAQEHKPLGELISKVLDEIQPDHGAKAQAGDTERAEAVLATEEKFDGNQQ
jgi:hypothetical protein